MTTQVEDIRRWLKEAQKRNSTHMIVVCDTFSYEDYPVYVAKGEDVRMVAERNDNPSNMSRVMEVYAMHLPLEDQLKEFRAFHYESPPT